MTCQSHQVICLEHILKYEKYSKYILINTIDIKDRMMVMATNSGSSSSSVATTDTTTTSSSSTTTKPKGGGLFSRLKETPAGDFPSRDERYLGDVSCKMDQEPEVWVEWSSSMEWEAGKIADKRSAGKGLALYHDASKLGVTLSEDDEALLNDYKRVVTVAKDQNKGGGVKGGASSTSASSSSTSPATTTTSLIPLRELCWPLEPRCWKEMYPTSTNRQPPYMGVGGTKLERDNFERHKQLAEYYVQQIHL